VTEAKVAAQVETEQAAEVTHRPGAPPGRRGRPLVAQETAQINAAAKQVDADTVVDPPSSEERRTGRRRRRTDLQPVGVTAKALGGGPPRRWYTAGTLASVEQGAAARRELIARLVGGGGRR